jgi:hypothetical protein
MTISRKLLIVAVVASGLIGGTVQTSSSWNIGFDYTLLKPLVSKAKQAVEAVTKSLEATRAACPDVKAFAKNLYTQQKNALKLIKAELKQAYKAAKLRGTSTWFADRQLYKAFKKFVYKNWKRTRLFPTF